MIQLRDYQEEAVTKLKSTANDLLNLTGNKTIVFKAPTGSGKTVIVAEFLKRFVENRTDEKIFSFIWTAPRKLHIQSKEKLEEFYKDSKALKCSYFEELTDKMIAKSEILFLNWESINQEDNIFIRENEQEFNLSNIIKNTADESRIIVLIIDESHHAAGTDTSRGLIQIFQPKISIEVSATPHLHSDEAVTVYREKVIAEGMIKKWVAINPEFKNIISGKIPDGIKIKSSADESTNEFVINIALAKREKLAKDFKDLGSNINPLMLIQLPDRRRGAPDIKDEVIEILRVKHDITVDSGKLAVYLSEDKENLELITKNESPTEVMIFKQAIALGWDCPRASILVLFRDWQSIIFSIQTVGRILRMPELYHYENEDINVGYVYTNLNDISIHEDVACSYLTIQHAIRKEAYENIALLSVYSKRFREITRLAPAFINHFLESAKEYNLRKKITTNIIEIKQSLITNGFIKEPDKEFEHLQEKDASDRSGETFERIQTETEIQNLFDNFVIESLTPLYPESRSVGRIKDAIYRYFQEKYPMKFPYGSVNVQMAVLSNKNKQKFLDVINIAKETYLEDMKKREKELEINKNWEVPFSRNYSDAYSFKEKSISILEPFYENNSASDIEKHFANFLDNKSDEIEWWFKNGERDRIFFAVPYTENDEEKLFYLDWIVKYKDGRIGLFDTKLGLTAEIAKTRAEGLSKYIKEEKKKGKNVFGGIITEKSASFWINDREEYKYHESNLIGSDWRIFS